MVQTAADGSKAAIRRVVGGCVCDRDTATPRGDTMDRIFGWRCDEKLWCSRKVLQKGVQQAPSAGDEDDEEPQTIG
jgi:hypothetical protein